MRVGTTPNCLVLKSRGTNFEYVGYPISGKDSRFLRNMASNLEKVCTIRDPLQPLERIKGKNDTLLSRAIARRQVINPLNAELNPICFLLALLAHHFLHVNRIRV